MKQPIQTKRRSTIRRSTDADMLAIHAWLVDQNARNIHGTFLCNWNLTEAQHQEGKLLVYVDGESEVPVAYQWGDLVSPGILEVRQDMRRSGIGKKLVARRIAQAYKRNQCLLVIQCKPSTSIPFWERMGFTLTQSDEGENYAYRILEKKHQLPSQGNHAKVAIRFYPEEKKWDHTASPYTTAIPLAVCTVDGVIHLGERISFLDRFHNNSQHAVVEIEVEDVIRYCDKAKSEKAEKIGVRRCTNGFYIDCIFPSHR